jgi:hypothetical protein
LVIKQNRMYEQINAFIVILNYFLRGIVRLKKHSTLVSGLCVAAIYSLRIFIFQENYYTQRVWKLLKLRFIIGNYNKRLRDDKKLC